MIRRAILQSVVLWTVVLGAYSGDAHAQDSNHWTLQWGSRSTLLGGAVIGSVSDLGAVYYNPARLMTLDKSAVLLTAKIYQYTTLNVNGQESKTGTSDLRPSPGMIAGTVPLKFDNHRFAYFLFSRSRWNSTLRVRSSQEVDIFDDSPGDERFFGEITSRLSLQDQWGGLSWAHTLSPAWSVGVSQILGLRTQSYSRRVMANVVDQSDQVAAAVGIRDFSYEDFRLITKLGVSFAKGPVNAGLTVTTPGFHLSGSGSITYANTLSGVERGGAGDLTDVSAASYQSGVDAKFKSPLSVGFGVAYHFEPVTVHTSAEWFDAIDKYQLMDTADIVSQTGGQIRQADVFYALDSVVNAGIGIDVDLGKKFTVYGSFVTDFTAAVDDPEINTVASDWNIYHFTGGTSLALGKTEITLGLAWAYGQRTRLRDFDFSRPSLGNGLLGDPAPVKISFRRVKALIGLSIDL